MSSRQESASASILAENIGGIDRTEVRFTPGVTVLRGENATNRTSLLQAIMAALGSDDVSLKADVDEGHVELEIGGSTYTRELTRTGSGIEFSGDPYLDDPTLADLFAFLLETNEARRAVVGQENLRELIMRPLDTDEINREIEGLLEERRELDQQLEELDSLKDRLPSLEERRAGLREEIEETTEELAEKEAEIEEQDAGVEETREEKEELEERLAELQSKRTELENVRYELETERESLESLRADRQEATAELEELPETPVGDIDDLEAEIDRLRDRKRELESEVNEIQTIIGFNQEMLEESDRDVLPSREDPPDDVTEELLADETVNCWTCGSEVPEAQIESTVERLQELSRSKLGEVNDIDSRIEELTADVEELREQQRRRETLEERITEAEREIDESDPTIERLEDRRAELQDDIEALEDEIDSMENEAYEEVLNLHREANQLEYELGRKQERLEDVEDEISALESRLNEERTIRADREELTEEIESLRTKIDRIESQAVEEFNDHMDAVLDILDYGNLERIWIERVERDVREGRRKVTKRVFELHIVRETEGGATYEDTIDHLSESEREVTGLIFALAGYLAHEVYEDVPFMLLDSLEAIDADRIARLVGYLEGYCEYLVVALLIEDAEAVEDAEFVGEI